jgi:hypothetical protein
MKNLQTYEQFLVEATPNYSFDGSQLKLGSYVTSLDGFSGMIISKEMSNGKIVFRDNKGIMHICESQYLLSHEEINEDLQWWEVTKGILAADMIKVGVAFAGGGLIVGASLFNHWRQGIANKIEKIRQDAKYKEFRADAEKIALKFNADEELLSKLKELEKFPYMKTIMPTGKRQSDKIKTNNNERSRLMREISKYVKGKLTSEEVKYFIEINKILRDKPLTNEEGSKIEEDNELSLLATINQDPQNTNPDSSINTDPNRIVGTGTYTTTWSDPSPMTKGFWNPKDASSAGTIPVYVGN